MKIQLHCWVPKIGKVNLLLLDQGIKKQTGKKKEHPVTNLLHHKMFFFPSTPKPLAPGVTISKFHLGISYSPWVQQGDKKGPRQDLQGVLWHWDGTRVTGVVRGWWGEGRADQKGCDKGEKDLAVREVDMGAGIEGKMEVDDVEAVGEGENEALEGELLVRGEDGENEEDEGEAQGGEKGEREGDGEGERKIEMERELEREG